MHDAKICVVIPTGNGLVAQAVEQGGFLQPKRDAQAPQDRHGLNGHLAILSLVVRACHTVKKPEINLKEKEPADAGES